MFMRGWRVKGWLEAHRRVRYALIACVLTLGFAIIGGTFFEWQRSKEGDPFPPAIRKAANFTIYYPRESDMVIDRKSVQLAEGNSLLAYQVQYQNHLFYVTVQAKPGNGLDLDTFSKQFSEPAQFLTANGTAIEGQLNGRQTGSLVTPDSWVLVSAPLKTPANAVADILKQLAPL